MPSGCQEGVNLCPFMPLLIGLRDVQRPEARGIGRWPKGIRHRAGVLRLCLAEWVALRVPRIGSIVPELPGPRQNRACYWCWLIAAMDDIDRLLSEATL